MSLYHIVFLGLVTGAIVEHLKKKTPKIAFLFLFLVMTVMLCLRFGQGTDYFSYAQIYYALPANPIEAIRSDNLHTEVGWKILCCLFKNAHLTYPVFVFAISVYMMILFYRFLRIYGGERKMLALLLSYHTLYLTYFFSALRQGIVIATFLGLLLPWIMERKYIRYCIVVVILSAIHSLSLLLLVLPLLQGLKLNVKQTVCMTIIGFLIGAFLTMIDLGDILYQIVPHIYFAEGGAPLFTVLERMATFIAVSVCFYHYAEGFEPKTKDGFLTLYKFYAFGLFLCGILMWSAVISSRTVYLLKVIEIVLLCACIKRSKKTGTVILCYCLMLSSLLYVKNVDSYLKQGQYENATVVSYPYVSVFNQTDILNYRQDTLGYPFQ